jgi:hypothetical protein|nr:MAG TPA: hypothetical protein [Caudoviricetes sp.]
MARINNLTNFLTDVATAIRSKKGSEATIAAEDFDTEILNLPAQGEYQDKSLEITTNGNYRVDPDTGYDAMTSVAIAVNISGEDATYAELFAIADNIYNPDVPDDSATANFTIDDEQVCLQRALKILKGVI